MSAPVPWISDARWSALSAAAKRADWVANVGASKVERVFGSGRLAGEKVVPATLATPGDPANSTAHTGVDTDGR